jgi:3-oxoadipate enol-lactonase
MPSIRTSGGLNMFYRESGSGDRVFLLVHGNCATSLWWERVMAQLPAGCRAVAPDLRGCGDTDKPEEQWTWQQLADDVYQFTQALGLSKVTLVGHSLGGTIGMQVAADHSDLVEKLVLVNPGPAEGLQMPELWWERSRPLVHMPDIMKMALGAMMPTAPKDDFYARLVEESVAKSVGAWLLHTKALEKTGALPRQVRELAAPTLIVCGKQDALITVPMMETLRDQIPGAVLEVWDEVGHSAITEVPERFTQRLVSF